MVLGAIRGSKMGYVCILCRDLGHRRARYKRVQFGNFEKPGISVAGLDSTVNYFIRGDLSSANY